MASVIDTGGLRRALSGDRAKDVLLWAVIALPVAAGGAELPLSVQLLAVPLLALAAAVSRRLPLAALAIPVALSLTVTPEFFTSSFTFALVALAFLLGRRSADARGALLLFTGIGAAGLPVVLAAHGATLYEWFALVITDLFAVVLPWLLGRYARRHAELVSTGWELAERLEREQELVADRMRLRERSRIAGDMHDSLGHELTLIAVRAAALQVTPGIGEEGRTAAAELRESAATATERLREIIGVLREDGEGAPVRPAGDTVDSLVERAAASGMTVTLVQPPTETPLPPMADRAVYRVVQEALTNAAKHAPGAAVTVILRRDDEHAEVTVANAPPPAGAPPRRSPADSGGYGLVGLDERIRFAGGTLHAQPVDDGFAVTARLPLHPGAAVAPPREYVAHRELARARRKVRRGMIDAIWVPIAVTAVLAVLMFGFNLYTSYRSVLDEDVYDELRIGQSFDSVESRLPAREAEDGGTPLRGAPADPRGTDDCRFYRTGPFSLSPAYRLCFTDGRLSHKDEVDIGP